MSPAPTIDNQAIAPSHQVVKQHNGNGVHSTSTTDGRLTSATVISMEHEYGAHK